MKEEAYRWWFSLEQWERRSLRNGARMTLDRLIELYIHYKC